MQTDIYKNALRLQRLMGNYLLYYELKLLQYEPARKNEWQQCEPIMTKEIISASVRKKAQEFDRQEDLVSELVETEIQIPTESLQKIVEELLDNAFHFSEPGTPVHVITKIDKEQWMLRITDQGSGLTIAQLDALKQKPGLGLKICWLLAQLHGGKLTIESEPNQGTIVTMVSTIKQS
jgi:two-component system sensor histidine kinase/response regulator